MIVAPGFFKQYPRLATWICDNLPKVKGKQKVFRAFQKYSGLNEKVSGRALQHGNPPVIEYRYLPADNGIFIGNKYPDTVFLSMSICDRFEGSRKDAEDPRMHLLLEATLLHEMVHQWQHETGRVVDHGAEFRRKAREVGITPAARRDVTPLERKRRVGAAG